jgi:hypothetical protein
MRLDRRVTALIDDLKSGRISHADGSLDSEALDGRIKALHAEVEDEESRVELIRLHNALMASSDRRLVEQGRDPEPLRREWRRAHLAFILAEALTGGEVDEAKFARVRAREVAAGRLHPDEALHIERVDPDPAPPGDGASGLERAYRALLLWNEEKMAPRLDSLVENFQYRLGHLEPGQDPGAVAEQESLEIGRWFEENVNGFLAEAVSYLGDDLLRDLKALGVESQFGSVIFEAIDDSRGELARRLGEARAAAAGQASG